MGMSTLAKEQSALFELGCATIWMSLRQAAVDQGCSFRPLVPVIQRGDDAGAYFIFAFELEEHITQITVHIDDILTSSRLWRQIDGAVKGYGGARTKTA